MRITNATPIFFKYKTILSKLFHEKKLPTVKYDFYGKLIENGTNEHVRPHSQGGLTNLANIVIADYTTNNARGDKPLIFFYKKENRDRYFDQFKGLKIPYIKRHKIHIFDGDEYIKLAGDNVDKLLKEESKRLNIVI